jgi:hypothetical protein
MEIGQRLAVIEPGDLGHEALDKLEDAAGAVDEAAQHFPRIDAGVSRRPRRASSRRALASSAGGIQRKVRK